jgi:UDP-N-acetylglucosamine 2-epimerase (non-hydrolysing)
MDAVFFEELGLRAPDHRLDVVRHFPLHGEQTAEMLRGIEQILLRVRPRLLVVGGDSNTHLAGALAARKLHIPIAHIEAGMRSYDWRMPEEHNRVMIDHISDLLLVHDRSAARVLRREHVRGRIHVVGTTIADAIDSHAAIAMRVSNVLDRLRVSNHYVLATVHREENVDNPAHLHAILKGLGRSAEQLGLDVILPAHPRTVQRMRTFRLGSPERIRVIEPLGYLDFLRLLQGASAVVTDSGGVQQEACILRVPCVTVRVSTEWTETIKIGANRLAEVSPDAISTAVSAAAGSGRMWTSPFKRGSAARIVKVITPFVPSKARELDG